jgi:hypothetical protein
MANAEKSHGNRHREPARRGRDLAPLGQASAVAFPISPIRPICPIPPVATISSPTVPPQRDHLTLQKSESLIHRNFSFQSHSKGFNAIQSYSKGFQKKKIVYFFAGSLRWPIRRSQTAATAGGRPRGSLWLCGKIQSKIKGIAPISHRLAPKILANSIWSLALELPQWQPS